MGGEMALIYIAFWELFEGLHILKPARMHAGINGTTPVHVGMHAIPLHTVALLQGPFLSYSIRLSGSLGWILKRCRQDCAAWVFFFGVVLANEIVAKVKTSDGFGSTTDGTSD